MRGNPELLRMSDLKKQSQFAKKRIYVSIYIKYSYG